MAQGWGEGHKSAYAAFAGRDLPQEGPRKKVTVLVLRFGGKEGGVRYTDKLQAVLQQKVLGSDKEGIEIKTRDEAVMAVDVTQQAVIAIGKQEKADLVVWGSVGSQGCKGKRRPSCSTQGTASTPSSTHEPTVTMWPAR